MVTTLTPSPASATQTPHSLEPEHNYSLPIESGLATDAVMYARDFGISHDEAMWRLTKQEELGDLVQSIERVASDQFAGSWIEHEGEFRLYVRLTGDQIPPAVSDVVAREVGPVTLLVGAARTAAEAEALLSGMGPELDEHEATQGVFYDIRTEEFVLDMVGVPTPTRTADEVIADLRSSLPAAVPTEVQDARIELLDAPIELARRGGLHLSNNCTSGFPVRNSAGQRGILTAGHCTNTQSYRLYGSSTWHSAPYRNGRWNHDTDAQWNQVTTNLVQPMFHASSEATARLLEGRRVRVDQSGHSICKRGMTTGYSCGVVTSITYRPTHNGACGGTTCSAVWVRTEGSNLRCNRGDSGGPVFFNNRAYGLTSVAAVRLSDGRCMYQVHMAINYMGSLGVTLYYA